MAIEPTTLVGIAAAVFVGAVLQRICGMGLGLVAAPSLALLIGPITGVSLSNGCAIVTASLVLWATREHVDWRRFARLAPLLVFGTVLGALVVGAVDPRWLNVLIGITVLLALGTAPMLRARARRVGAGAQAGTGVVAGFMSATAGVAAPAMTAYAIASGWEQRSFAATLQPIFLTVNVASLLAKFSLGSASSLTGVPWWLWLSVMGLAAVGIGVGALLASRVSAGVARRIAVTLAVAGGAAALAKGLLG